MISSGHVAQRHEASQLVGHARYHLPTAQHEHRTATQILTVSYGPQGALTAPRSSRLLHREVSGISARDRASNPCPAPVPQFESSRHDPKHRQSDCRAEQGPARRSGIEHRLIASGAHFLAGSSASRLQPSEGPIVCPGRKHVPQWNENADVPGVGASVVHIDDQV